MNGPGYRESEMYGKITKFRSDIGVGVILAEDGQKFRFRKGDVVNLNGRLVGHEVDFIPTAAQSKDIVLLTGTPWNVFSNQGS